MSDTRWTVRNVERGAIAKVHEVAGICGEPIGVLVSAAIEDWYRRLPTEEDLLATIPSASLAILFQG